MIYKCENCGLLIQTPNKSSELIGEYQGVPVYVPFNSCPNCESVELIHGKLCDCGNEYIFDNEPFCESCMKIGKEAVGAAIDYIVKQTKFDKNRAEELFKISF